VPLPQPQRTIGDPGQHYAAPLPEPEDPYARPNDDPGEGPPAPLAVGGGVTLIHLACPHCGQLSPWNIMPSV